MWVLPYQAVRKHSTMVVPIIYLSIYLSIYLQLTMWVLPYQAVRKHSTKVVTIIIILTLILYRDITCIYHYGWTGYPVGPDIEIIRLDIQYCRIFGLTLLKLSGQISDNFVFYIKQNWYYPAGYPAKPDNRPIPAYHAINLQFSDHEETRMTASINSEAQKWKYA